MSTQTPTTQHDKPFKLAIELTHDEVERLLAIFDLAIDSPWCGSEIHELVEKIKKELP